MATIITPVPGYSGISAGVTFSNGVGRSDDARLFGWFRRKGYKVLEDTEYEDVGMPKGTAELADREDHGAAALAGSASSPADAVPSAVPSLAAADSVAPDHAETGEFAGESAADAAQDMPQTPEPPSPLDRMTRAAQRGIDIAGISAKSNILAKIKEAERGK